MGRISERVQQLLFGGSVRWKRLLVYLGIGGILLIGLSEWLPRSADEGSGAGAAQTETLTAAQLEAALENRLLTLLTQMEGVGQCQVMVTLERGTQKVYATDRTEAGSGTERESFGESYLTLETEAGLVGLSLAELQPQVRGVAVVCEGGGSASVQKRVTALVTATLDISARRVCVDQIKLGRATQ